MRLWYCFVIAVTFVSAKDNSVATAEEESKTTTTSNEGPIGNNSTKPKRGLLDLGYGYGFGHRVDYSYGEAFDHHNYGLGFVLHEPVKRVTITRTVPHIVTQPFPVEVTKKVPIPFKFAVPVHVSLPYPVVVEKKVPYSIQRHPIPLHVSVKVPVARPVGIEVPQSYPVPIAKPIPVPVEKPIVVEKPFFIHDNHVQSIGLDEY